MGPWHCRLEELDRYDVKLVQAEKKLVEHDKIVAELKVTTADLKKATDRLWSYEQRTAALERKAHHFEETSIWFMEIRNRFISMYKRDTLQSRDFEDDRIIGSGNNRAHGGYPVPMPCCTKNTNAVMQKSTRSCTGCPGRWLPRVVSLSLVFLLLLLQDPLSSSTVIRHDATCILPPLPLLQRGWNIEEIKITSNQTPKIITQKEPTRPDDVYQGSNTKKNAIFHAFPPPNPPKKHKSTKERCIPLQIRLFWRVRQLASKTKDMLKIMGRAEMEEGSPELLSRDGHGSVPVEGPVPLVPAAGPDVDEVVEGPLQLVNLSDAPAVKPSDGGRVGRHDRERQVVDAWRWVELVWICYEYLWGAVLVEDGSS